jgi:hypothetical protein
MFKLIFLSVVDMDGYTVDVVSGTACILCRVQGMDVGAAVLGHSVGVMRAPRRIGRVARLAGPTPLSRGRRLVEDRRARDSLAVRQPHGMYLANLIVRLWLRTGRSAHSSKVGQHLARREARRASAVSGDLGVSP